MPLQLHPTPLERQRNPKRLKWILLAAAAVMLLLFIITAADTQNITGLEGVLGFIVRPVQSGVRSITVAVSDAVYSLFDNQSATDENAALRLQIQQLQLQLAEAEESLQEARRLNGLQDAADSLYADNQAIAARVIGKSPGYWFNLLVINKGSSQGMAPDMAVVNAQGVVGRIVEVGPTWSKVMTIIDGESSVAGMLQVSRDNGMVKGTVGLEGDQGLCRMYYLPFDATLTPGDAVVTSGLGGFFPKGLALGTVLEVDRSADTGEEYALLRPAVDFTSIENVLVLSAPTQEYPDNIEVTP